MSFWLHIPHATKIMCRPNGARLHEAYRLRTLWLLLSDISLTQVAAAVPQSTID